MSQDRTVGLIAKGRAATSELKRSVLARLLVAWEAAPALRLGQLLVHTCEKHDPPLPLFAVEDVRLVEMAEALTVVPEAKAHDLTPSEAALAKVLAAWEEWPGDLDHHRETLLKIGDALAAHLLIAEGQPSEEGRDLLARARKAGVL